ncbi:MAG: ATP-dependent DNA helicase RecG [Eubacterium sp.]|nr:ATP-dependent DNA helicase RecG [Eubacterium sp.]
MDITYLKGVGPKRAELYRKLGIETAEQLIELYPRDYVDLTAPVTVAQAHIGEVCAFRAFVMSKKSPFNEYARMALYKAELSDGTGNITAVFFNTKYAFGRLETGREYIFYGKITGDEIRKQISTPLFVDVSENVLMPKYPLTAGLSNNMVSANVKTALQQVTVAESLPQPLIEKLGLLPRETAVRQIHFPRTRQEYTEARRRLVLEELLTLKLGLSLMKRRGREHTGAVMKPADITPLWRALPFEPTNAQKNAVRDCIADMQREFPMNRLIQGDVGSGKTLVAAAAAYFAFLNGHGTMVMAPTEVLAQQHYKTFTEMLSGLGVRVELLSGSLTIKEKNDVRRRAESGEIDVLIGTQALIQKTSAMNSAGLVIVDEQHRFGVSQRSTLAEKGKAPHILAMSATPIPRTLALIIYGDLDVSILGEMPKGRLPVKTYAVDGSFRQRVYNFIKKHIAAGRQAYIVCPLVESSEGKSEKASAIEYYDRLVNGDFRDIPTGLLYGKLKQSEKEQVMSDFKAGKLKLLVSTTVIEVGIDVPNAVVILIENAEQFGLSQLHQLRGRVGRGSEQSFCVLMTDNRSDYTKARMDAMVRTTNGFEIAQEDLELRGPGNFFGREQHGLPPLKVADIADDAGLLTEADRVSAAILSADPQLTRPENELLRRNVERLFGGSGEYGWN